MLLAKLVQSPIVPVFYHSDIDVCKSVLSQCYAGGLRVFEFVDRGIEARKNFELLLNYRNEFYKDLLLGIGTIKNENQAKDFIALGADFLVSPIVNTQIADVVRNTRVEWVPGCMTPTEIAMAEQLGASIIKLFPGDSLGPKFVKAVQPLFPEVHFMVTGGVSLTPESLKSWFQAGVKAVGIGSKLFEGEFISGDKGIESNLKEGLAFINSLEK